MHSERDYLVKHIIPQLRKKCEERRIHLVEVDLRWGVTEEEAKTGQVLKYLLILILYIYIYTRLCLQEVDRCHIFAGLIGDRYGWTPSPQQVPDEVKVKYEWKAGHSVTAMEITQAFKQSKNCSFYFRNSSVYNSIPGNCKSDFVESQSEIAQRLSTLKQSIKTKKCPVFEYSPSFKGLDSNGKPILGDMEIFGEQFLANTWAAIEKDYPIETSPPDPLDIESAYHNQFLETRVKNFVGRQQAVDQMRDYIENGPNKPLVVSGGAGAGKSALMGHFASMYSNERRGDVIVHFVGASPQSTNIEHVLWRLTGELQRR